MKLRGYPAARHLVLAVATAGLLAIGIAAAARDHAAAQETPTPNVQKVVAFHRTIDRLCKTTSPGRAT
jgi:hypothetical protein